MGGLFKLDINGLSEDQIDEYVDNFSLREGHKLDVSKATTSSKGYLPIMNVPQFLNTLCCVAVLMKGHAVLNSTELYCWTVYLLLRQHADKQQGREQGTISRVFKRYSQTLVSLSELCYNLLKENKIIFEGNIESKLGKTEEEKNFIKSLFVDVGDNFKEKYKFKHLSLMEFLSALYICREDTKSRMEIIKDHLKKGLIEVVSFVCRLMSGFSYEGIIKETLKNAVGLKRKVDEKQLLSDVIMLLNKCGLGEWTKLERSFEFVTFFLTKDFNDKEFIFSIIVQCSSDNFWSYEYTTENVCKICRHLESCGWKKEEIRAAFEKVHFKQFFVSNVELVDFAIRYLRIGDHGIRLRNMKMTVGGLRMKFKEMKNGYHGLVSIWNCELEDETKDSGLLCGKLKRLEIERCKLKNEASFSNLCNWGISCECFWLWDLDIADKWWKTLVDTIEERKANEDLHMRILDIRLCTTKMSDDLAMRVRRLANL